MALKQSTMVENFFIKKYLYHKNNLLCKINRKQFYTKGEVEQAIGMLKTTKDFGKAPVAWTV
jgi:hypothetical protein